MKSHRLQNLGIIALSGLLVITILFALILRGCGGGGGGGGGATLIRIEVTPTNPSIAKGTTQQFTATGVYSDNTTLDMTHQVNWSSSDTGVATISWEGIATTIAVGTTTITATSYDGRVSGSTTLTVTPATLTSISVTPANPSIAKGMTQQFTATGTFSDSTTQNLTTQVTWSSTNTEIATIGSTGLATSVAVGATTISATSGSISGTTTLTVTPVALVSISVTPANPSIAKGTTQQFTATGTFSDSTTQNLTTQVTWSSTNTGVATIASTGLATSVAVGTTTISATSGSISGTTTLTVTPALLVSIAVTPANAGIPKGATQPYTATGTFSDGTTQDLTTSVTWDSSDTSVATISNASGSNGLVTAIAVGSTIITATSGDISGNTPLTVTQATAVCGTISSNSTWTLAASPYLVNCNVLVNSGVTLTIEPGVKVMFNSGTAIQIDGTLIARGTSSNMITYTSSKFTPAPGDWSYILFSDSSTDATFDGSGNYVSGSILEYSVVEYAGVPSYSSCMAAVMATNASPFINHDTIRNNAATGIFATSYNYIGYSKITNCTITNNKSSGSCEAGGIVALHFTISKNIIKDNTGSHRGGGIYGSGSSISHNIISGNTAQTGGGIHSYGDTISNNIIVKNTATGGELGGGIGGEPLSITNNTISRNTAADCSAFAPSPYVSSNIQYNTITGNTATGSAPAAAVCAYQASQVTYNNIFADNAPYEIRNLGAAGTTAVDATNNWWGSAIESQIQAEIYDWYDGGPQGIINYNPWSTAIRTDAPISPPTGLAATSGAGQIGLSWSANPEADTAGYKVYWGTSPGFPYANVADVGNVTSYTIGSLPAGTYYVTVTAYDTDAASVTDDPDTPVNEKQTSGHESWYAVEKMVSVQ